VCLVIVDRIIACAELVDGNRRVTLISLIQTVVLNPLALALPLVRLKSGAIR
jgi:hypothetical protein